jgi:hypothetical protein
MATEPEPDGAFGGEQDGWCGRGVAGVEIEAVAKALERMDGRSSVPALLVSRWSSARQARAGTRQPGQSSACLRQRLADHVRCAAAARRCCCSRPSPRVDALFFQKTAPPFIPGLLISSCAVPPPWPLGPRPHVSSPACVPRRHSPGARPQPTRPKRAGQTPSDGRRSTAVLPSRCRGPARRSRSRDQAHARARRPPRCSGVASH